MRKPAVSLIAKIGLAVGLLAYLIYSVDPARLLATASQAKPRWILVALLLLPVNLFIEATVWHRLVRVVAPDVSFREAAGSLLCGYPLGTFTPARIGDIAGRAFYLRHPDNWELGCVVFTQRILDMVVSINVGFLALLYFLPRHPLPAPSFWWGLAALGGVLAMLLVIVGFFPALIYRLISRITQRLSVLRRVTFLRRLSRTKMAGILSLNVLRYVIYCTQLGLLVFAFMPAMDLFRGLLGASLVFFAKFLIPPVTFLDIGIREGISVFFFSQMGVGQAAAFNGSFLLFCINLLLPALIGLPFVLRMRLPSSKPKNETSSAAVS